MSVINKMLRDLDLRQVGQPVGAAGQGAVPELRQGTASVGLAKTVHAQHAQASVRLWLGLAVLLVLVVVAGVGAWWLNHSASPQEPTSAMAPASNAPLPEAKPPTTASAVVATASSPMVSLAASSVANSSMNLRMEPSLSAQRALDALLSAPTPAPAPAPAPAAAPVVAQVPPPIVGRSNTNPVTPQATQSSAPATAPAASIPAKTHTNLAPANAATASTGTTTDSTPVVQRQQQAGGDAMAQAQTLWNAGSHDAAIDLMQQSIAAAERSAKTAGNPAGSTVLLALVREMTRMQLSEGRYGAVWELLTHLEPLLGNQPDLWAIRANAAQRLGRHQDSVHAYMMALQSRPDEPRWLLGTAVSLAALGQTSSATEMAERARALAPVSKEILAYLRQAGVTLRDPQ